MIRFLVNDGCLFRSILSVSWKFSMPQVHYGIPLFDSVLTAATCEKIEQFSLFTGTYLLATCISLSYSPRSELRGIFSFNSSFISSFTLLHFQICRRRYAIVFAFTACSLLLEDVVEHGVLPFPTVPIFWPPLSHFTRSASPMTNDSAFSAFPTTSQPLPLGRTTSLL